MPEPPRPTLTSIPPRPDTSKEVGTRIGRYELVREIATGGMGSVWVASAAGNRVALKRVKKHLLSDPALAERVFQAARAAMRIKHENVVATLDVMVNDGELCIVTELVDAEHLKALVRAATTHKMPLSGAVSVRILLDVLAGLEAAHACDAKEPALHGDLSPENVFVTTDGRAMLIDFGLAKAFVGTAASPAKNREKVGYQAPEQLRPAPTSDARSDIFAVGVLAWELLADKRLFESKYEAAIAQKILTTTPPKLDALGKASPALAAVIARALERDARKRFASAKEMAAALTEAAAGGIASAADVAVTVDNLVGVQLQARRKALETVDWPGEEPPTIPKAARVPKEAVHVRPPSDDAATMPMTDVSKLAALVGETAPTLDPTDVEELAAAVDRHAPAPKAAPKASAPGAPDLGTWTPPPGEAPPPAEVPRAPSVPKFAADEAPTVPKPSSKPPIVVPKPAPPAPRPKMKTMLGVAPPTAAARAPAPSAPEAIDEISVVEELPEAPPPKPAPHAKAAEKPEAVPTPDPSPKPSPAVEAARTDAPTPAADPSAAAALDVPPPPAALVAAEAALVGGEPALAAVPPDASKTDEPASASEERKPAETTPAAAPAKTAPEPAHADSDEPVPVDASVPPPRIDPGRARRLVLGVVGAAAALIVIAGIASALRSKPADSGGTATEPPKPAETGATIPAAAPPTEEPQKAAAPPPVPAPTPAPTPSETASATPPATSAAPPSPPPAEAPPAVAETRPAKPAATATPRPASNATPRPASKPSKRPAKKFDPSSI